MPALKWQITILHHLVLFFVSQCLSASKHCVALYMTATASSWSVTLKMLTGRLTAVILSWYLHLCKCIFNLFTPIFLNFPFRGSKMCRQLRPGVVQDQRNKKAKSKTTRDLLTFAPASLWLDKHSAKSDCVARMRRVKTGWQLLWYATPFWKCFSMRPVDR